MAVRFFAVILFFCLFSFPSYAQVASEMDYDATAHEYNFFDGANSYFMSLGITGAACTKEGERDYDGTLHVYKYCNGTNWVLMTGTPTVSVCSKDGEIDFFSSSYHYCNGTVWVDMQGTLIP